jgi:DHA2 family methylenomycin A resistance protein-like MFS transporter
VLVAARVLQGVGAALLLPGTLAIITRTFPEPAAQARAIGVCAGVGSVALPVGPLLGGGLVATWRWRTMFLVNVPVVPGWSRRSCCWWPGSRQPSRCRRDRDRGAQDR